MDEHFWQLIDDARFEGKEDDVAVCDILIRKLGICDEDGLVAFEAFFTDQLEALNASAVRNLACEKWRFNDETWLFFRAWIVSRGGEFFSATLSSTKHAIAVLTDEFPGEFNAPNGERFLQCVEKAREKLPEREMRN